MRKITDRAIAEKVASHLKEDEKVLYSMSLPQGNIVVTNKRLLRMPSGASQGIEELPLSMIEAIRTRKIQTPDRWSAYAYIMLLTAIATTGILLAMIFSPWWWILAGLGIYYLIRVLEAMSGEYQLLSIKTSSERGADWDFFDLPETIEQLYHLLHKARSDPEGLAQIENDEGEDGNDDSDGTDGGNGNGG